jgi:hypothetical protein
MGLFDDAIREHLELKRRHGRDVAVAARQERRARHAVRPGEPAVDEPWGTANAAFAVEDRRTGKDPASAAVHARSQLPPSLDQETAELDMRTVFDQEHDEGIAAVGPVVVAPVGRPSTAERAPGSADPAEDWLQSESRGDVARADDAHRVSRRDAARDQSRLIW